MLAFIELYPEVGVLKDARGEALMAPVAQRALAGAASFGLRSLAARSYALWFHLIQVLETDVAGIEAHLKGQHASAPPALTTKPLTYFSPPSPSPSLRVLFPPPLLHSSLPSPGGALPRPYRC